MGGIVHRGLLVGEERIEAPGGQASATLSRENTDLPFSSPVVGREGRV